MESKGRQIHAKAELAREKGEFQDALEYTDQATLQYQLDNDLLGLAEVQSSRQSIFKQLYRKTQDSIFLILEKHSALAAVEIAEQSEIKEALGIPYHNLGKYYFENQEYEKAVEYFRKAVENLTNVPNSRHSRQSVIADIKGHQYTAEYKNGDKTVLEHAEQALADLESSEEPNKYNKDVWLSGAHLRIADAIRKDNPEKAKDHLEKAKQIIASNPDLILRKQQLDKLIKFFS